MFFTMPDIPLVSASALARSANVPVSRILREVEAGRIAADFRSEKEILFLESRIAAIAEQLRAEGPRTKELLGIENPGQRTAFWRQHRAEILRERTEEQFPAAVVLDRTRTKK